MFDIPRPCGRCGRRDVTDPALDVCDYCLHLDHRSPGPAGCRWCWLAASSPQDAAAKGATASAEADPEFAHAATQALAVVRNRREPFTAAEVRATLESWGVTITRPAAIGAVFTAASAAGIIRATGDFVPSPVKGQHGRPLRVWVAA
jgi:hypothetical protein